MGLRWADRRDIHAEQGQSELPRQIARRATSAAPDVQQRRSRPDSDPAGEGQDFACRQRAFLPDVRVSVGQGCPGQSAGSEPIVKAARVRRLTLNLLSPVTALT